MIPKLEFGQLYKFVVSLGFVLMAAAVIGPWAILRDQGALSVSRATLEGLTPRAQRILELKQQHAEWIATWYPWAALLLFLAGASLAVWGLIRWWSRQLVADLREDVDLAVQRRTLEPLTPQEKEERLETEVSEALVAAGATDELGESVAAPTGTVSEEAPSVREDKADSDEQALRRRQPSATWIAFREELRGVERLAAMRISDALRETHRVEAGVKVRIDDAAGGYADLVAIALPGTDLLNLVIDVKYDRTLGKNSRNRLTESLLKGASVAAGLGRGRFATLTIFVVAEDAVDTDARLRLLRATEELRATVSFPIGAVVLSESELRSLSSTNLRKRLTDALVGSPPEVAPSTTRASQGWTRETLDRLLDQLALEAPVQEAAIRFAAMSGGYVGREDIYRLGEYDPDRSLRGFTRPVNRVVEELRDTGGIPESAEDVLIPVYDQGAYGPGRVDGFRVPPAIAALLER